MKKKILKIIPILLILMVSVFVMTACVDADPVVQLTKMSEKGYYVPDTVDNTVIVSQEGCEKAYHFVKMNPVSGAIAESVWILYFYTPHAAAKYETERFIPYSMYELQKRNPELAERMTYVRASNIFIFGTENAVNDALN